MKKHHLTLLCALLLLCFNAFSQSKILDNVIEVDLQSSVEITNNKQIVGYAIFYKIDKMKKSAKYRLSILDENLKEIGSNEFEGPKDLKLTRAAYESDQILLNFYDEDKTDGYKWFAKVYDLKGKEKGLTPYDPEKVKKGMFGAAAAASMEAIYDGTDNIEGKGFVVVHQSKAKVGGVDIQMIGSNGKLAWEQSITGEKGDRTDAYMLGTTPNTILFFEMDRGSIMSKDADIFLVGMNADNGSIRFKKPLDINGISYEPMMIKKSGDGKLKVVSTMYNEGAKFASAKPIGISIADLNDLTGEVKTVKDFKYLGDLDNVMDMKNESKSENGYIKAHDVLLMPDGSYVLVGEFFRRTVSGLGVASKLLSSGPTMSATQATIEDMFLLRIDNKLKAVDLEKIEKDKDRCQLPGDGLSVGIIARYLTYTRQFGYMYTDEGMDGNGKTILARGSFGEEKYGTVAITVNDKKGFSTKRFNLEKEKHVVYFISRAKPGFVMVMKYNSKEKTINFNLEKVK